MAINPQGTLAYVVMGNSPGTVNIINLATNTLIGTINIGLQPEYLALNPQGTLVYVSQQNSFSVNVLSTYPWVTINPALITPTIAASNTPTVQTGKYETFSAYEPSADGTSPFTYNFIVYNSITNAILTSSLQTTNTFSWLIPSAASQEIPFMQTCSSLILRQCRSLSTASQPLQQ